MLADLVDDLDMDDLDTHDFGLKNDIAMMSLAFGRFGRSPDLDTHDFGLKNDIAMMSLAFGSQSEDALGLGVQSQGAIAGVSP